MNHCLDEGTLHAYLDGELAPAALNGVASHLASCAACADAARDAEGELALFATASAPVFSSAHVPTQRLRARLDEAIAEMQASTARSFVMPAAPSPVRDFFAGVAAFLTTFTPRQATAFAGLIVAVALAVVFYVTMRSPVDAPDEVATVNKSAAPISQAVTSTPDRAPSNSTSNNNEQTLAPVDSSVAPGSAQGRGPRMFVAAKYERPDARQTNAARSAQPNGSQLNNANAPAAANNDTVLTDEKTYLSSIASLTSVIETQGSTAMTPTLRAEYERNLAVVNQAIASSRVAARRSPQDEDAKEFLRAAYQNKVELLSAVADQAQVASARD